MGMHRADGTIQTSTQSFWRGEEPLPPPAPATWHRQILIRCLIILTPGIGLINVLLNLKCDFIVLIGHFHPPLIFFYFWMLGWPGFSMLYHCCQDSVHCDARQPIQQEEATLIVTGIFGIFNALFYYHQHNNNNSNISDNHFIIPPVSNIQTWPKRYFRKTAQIQCKI